MRLEYRDRGDVHLKVLEGDDGSVELRLTDKHDVEHRLKLTAERARELLSALLLVIPPRRKRWPPPLIARRMRAMAQDTKPEPAEPAKDQPTNSAKPRRWQIGEYGVLVVDKPGSTFAIVGTSGVKPASAGH
jgi:hypothetical protein